MNSDLDAILDDCLVRLREGGSVEDCLMKYPDQADELLGLLVAAKTVFAIPTPRASLEAFRTGEQRILEAFSTQVKVKDNPNSAVSFSGFIRNTGQIKTILRTIFIGKETKNMKLVYRIAFDFFVILIVAGIMTVRASASSLPGDSLYGVKRSWEQVRLTFTVNPQTQQELQSQFNEGRQFEIQKLQTLGRQATVEFQGILETIASDQWTVGGLAIKVNEQTVIEGNPQIGRPVAVSARIQNHNPLIALHVTVEETTPAPSQASGPNPHATKTMEATAQSTMAVTYTPMPLGTVTSTQQPITTPMPPRMTDVSHEQMHGENPIGSPMETSLPANEPDTGTMHHPGQERGPSNGPVCEGNCQPQPTRDNHSGPMSTQEPGHGHH